MEELLALCECTKIAGNKTVGDWKKRKTELGERAPASLWALTFDEFFKARIHSRYFRPIKILKRKGGISGAGFAIVTIQCSLIEFLAASRFGKKYVHGGDESEEVYVKTGEFFTNFISSEAPFNEVFLTDKLATEFYTQVRCGLLHEASTKGLWRIQARSINGQAICFTDKIVFRNDLQKVYNRYLRSYKSQLLEDSELQKTFIRKFDFICEGC
ncbi:MAG: hypothetical protein CME91_00305 [Hyphomonadaceae bacterium]|nr:hypothetical protein [Hyphomonadaceae bacterium]